MNLKNEAQRWPTIARAGIRADTMTRKSEDAIELIPVEDEPDGSRPARGREPVDFDLPAPIELPERQDAGAAAETDDDRAAKLAGLDQLFEDIGVEAEAAVAERAVERVEASPANTPARGAFDSSPGDVEPQAEAAQAALSADDLFADVSADGAEPLQGPGEWTQADQAMVETKIEQLGRARSEVLELYKQSGGDANAAAPLDRARGYARELLESGADLIDSLARRPEAKDSRQGLVDAYFRLQRAVEQGTGGETGAHYETIKKKTLEPDAAARELVRRAKESARPRLTLGRAGKLGLLFGVLLAARLALYFAGGARQDDLIQSQALELPAEVGVITDFHGHKPGQPDGGELSVRSIVLTQSPDGLQVNVICGTKNLELYKSLTYTYTWFENNEILSVGSSQTLDASKLKAKATYHVEVSVAAGNKTASAASKKLAYTAGKTDGKEQ